MCSVEPGKPRGGSVSTFLLLLGKGGWWFWLPCWTNELPSFHKPARTALTWSWHSHPEWEYHRVINYLALAKGGRRAGPAVGCSWRPGIVLNEGKKEVGADFFLGLAEHWFHPVSKILTKIPVFSGRQVHGCLEKACTVIHTHTGLKGTRE